MLAEDPLVSDDSDGCDGPKRGLTLTNCTGSGKDSYLSSKQSVFFFGSVTNRQHTHILILLSSTWNSIRISFFPLCLQHEQTEVGKKLRVDTAGTTDLN